MLVAEEALLSLNGGDKVAQDLFSISSGFLSCLEKTIVQVSSGYVVRQQQEGRKRVSSS